MRSEDEKLRQWFSEGKCSMVRGKQAGRFHTWLQLQNDSPEAAPEGVNMGTHTETPLVMARHPWLLPVGSHPGSRSQSTAEKNLTYFWVMKQGENQGTKKPRNIRMGSAQCCCLCTSGSLSEAVKAGRRSRILVLWSRQKCELINDSAFKTWIDSHTPDTLFHCHFAPPQPCSTPWVLKRNRDVFHIFSVWIKKCLPWNDQSNTPEQL